MTAARQLEIKGEKRGMQQGMQQEKLHIAKNMLSKLHLDIKSVKEATGLSEEALLKLQEEAKR
jgi:predicted transposase/invertase (TIGR01784 family)